MFWFHGRKPFMAKEKQSVLVVSTQKKPLATLKSNYKEFERLFKHWFVNDAFSSACVAIVCGAIPYTFGPEYALPHRFATFATKHVNTNPLVKFPLPWWMFHFYLVCRVLSSQGNLINMLFIFIFFSLMNHHCSSIGWSYDWSKQLVGCWIRIS